jgi:hypothetical protein
MLVGINPWQDFDKMYPGSNILTLSTIKIEYLDLTLAPFNVIVNLSIG